MAETDKTAKLEQKLGKLQYRRMQVEAQMGIAKQEHEVLSKEIFDIAQEMVQLKTKPKTKEKQHGEGTD